MKTHAPPHICRVSHGLVQRIESILFGAMPSCLQIVEAAAPPCYSVQSAKHC